MKASTSTGTGSTPSHTSILSNTPTQTTTTITTANLYPQSIRDNRRLSAPVFPTTATMNTAAQSSSPSLNNSNTSSFGPTSIPSTSSPSSSSTVIPNSSNSSSSNVSLPSSAGGSTSTATISTPANTKYYQHSNFLKYIQTGCHSKVSIDGGNPLFALLFIGHLSIKPALSSFSYLNDSYHYYLYGLY